MADTLLIRDVDLTAAGHDVRMRAYPAAEPDGTVLVWLHGGAFMFGDLEMPEADETARQLARRGTTVISLEYTLAPTDAVSALPAFEPVDGMPSPDRLAASFGVDRARAPYPVASLQVVAAFDWARANAAEFGGRADAVALGGASAGGNLAAGAALRLRDRGGAQPLAQVLVYPVLHAVLPEPDDELTALLDQLPPSLRFPPEATRAINANYLGGASPDEIYAFPGGHDVSGAAAALIVTSEGDELRPSAEAYVGDLARGGVDVEYVNERGAIHGFLNMVGSPAAARTADRVSRFLRERAGEDVA
jgi:acetyl esterase